MNSRHRARRTRIGTKGAPAIIAALCLAAGACAAGPAAAATAKTSFAVSVSFTPTMKQSLQAAEIKVLQPDGSSLALTPQQRARYLEEPSSIANAAPPGTGRSLVVVVEF